MHSRGRRHRLWGGLVVVAGLAIVVLGAWLGASMGWDFTPSAAYVDRGVEAARGGLATIAIGTIVTVVGFVVAFAPDRRR